MTLRVQPGLPGRSPLPLAVPLLLLGLLASSLLRVFHTRTPHLFPGPAGSLLGLAVLLLALLHLAGRRRGDDLLAPPGDAAARLTLGKVAPLLLLLFAEKWVTVDWLRHAYDWVDLRFADPRAADAAYRLWSALALAGVGLAGVWLLRQIGPRLARLFEPRRCALALALLAGSLLLVGGGAALFARAAGGLGWTAPSLPAAILPLALAAQLVRGASEELFYRGLVQTALARLLAESGLGEGRASRALAIAAVSIGFTLEHVDPGMPPRRAAASLLFVLAMAALLGLLLEASRNLYLVMLAHAAVNWIVAGLVPLPSGADGTPLLPPAAFVMLLFAFIFTGVVISHRRHGFA